MKKKLKSSLKIVSIALILVLVVSMICMSGSAADTFDIESHQSWGNLPAALPIGTVNYYAVSCVSETTLSTVSKYLKIEKTDDNLVVYEGDSLDGFSQVVSTNFIASAGGYTEADKKESWTVSLIDEISAYSKILSVSPLCTTIISEQTWAAKDSDGNYVDVAAETTVKFSLNDGTAEGQTFYVKKNASSGYGIKSLMISVDNENSWNYAANNIVLPGGRTINALLVASYGNTNPEKWIITATGFNRTDPDGRLIEYSIDKKNLNSSQAWKSSEAKLEHSFNGWSASSGTFVYTLRLTTPVGEEIGILQIEKQMENGSVVSLTVKGMEDNTQVYSTLVEAETFNDMNLLYQYADDYINRIEFNNDSAIRISDITGSGDGITVNFNIGRDNGSAAVVLKLTPAGRLSYSFDGLPADSFVTDMTGTDQDGDSIAVVSYRVDVTVEN